MDASCLALLPPRSTSSPPSTDSGPGEAAVASPPCGSRRRLRPARDRALDGADPASLWDAFRRTGDPALRNSLVEHYLYIVTAVSRRLAKRLPRTFAVEDLAQVGTFGLLRAIRRFDPSRGTRFDLYAARCVRGAIQEELRSQDWVPRLARERAARYWSHTADLRQRLGREPSAAEVGQRLGIPPAEAEALAGESDFPGMTSLDEFRGGRDGGAMTRAMRVAAAADSRFGEMVARDLAKWAASLLEPTERTIVALYYHENLTLRGIGEVLGLSESRVCQIHAALLRKLRERLCVLR